MTRVWLLRAGYAAVGVAFACLAATFFAGAALPLGLVVAFIGAVLLAFSDDDLPKWAGIVLVAYFLVSALAFVASTPITIRTGGRYYIDALSPGLGDAIGYYLGLAIPVMVSAAAIAAAWEREKPVRLLIAGALAGFLLVGVLTYALAPSTAEDVSRATQQGALLATLFAVSGLAGAAGSLWAAARPEEYA